jgi:23S rRNA (cytidine1920-2'-O)/16S rRNA (cytidine1409-2'-O)-methyltransferase
MSKDKIRIDRLLVDLGLVESRNKAHALIMAGLVIVEDKRVEKPSEVYTRDIKIRIKNHTSLTKYVSRGGIKLEKALRDFNIMPNGYVCLDIGASTGGFTDCLLQNGAARVVAIDVGRNQLAWKLRIDERVELRESVNARYLTPHDFEERFDLITIDVSFISLKKIIPPAVSLLNEKGRIIALIKPQFEVGKKDVDKGGVVKDEYKRKQAVEDINIFVESLGMKVRGTIESPITGAEGNKEFLSLYSF